MTAGDGQACWSNMPSNTRAHVPPRKKENSCIQATNNGCCMKCNSFFLCGLHFLAKFSMIKTSKVCQPKVTFFVNFMLK